MCCFLWHIALNLPCSPATQIVVTPGAWWLEDLSGCRMAQKTTRGFAQQNSLPIQLKYYVIASGSCDTVDGRNPAPVDRSFIHVYPFICKVLYIPGGFLGFIDFSVCRLRPEATAPQPASAPNTGQCLIDYKYVDSQTITVKLKGESAVAAAAAPAGITTFCPKASDTFIIERKSSLQSCMRKRRYTSCYTHCAQTPRFRHLLQALQHDFLGLSFQRVSYGFDLQAHPRHMCAARSVLKE